MDRGQSFLLLLIAAVSVVTLLIVAPFVEYVIAAVILAYVLFPLHDPLSKRFQERIGDRGPLTNRAAEMASAIGLIVSAAVAVILPLAYVTLVFVEDLTEIAAGDTGLRVAAIERRVLELTGREVDVEAWLVASGEAILRNLFGGVGDILNGLLRASLGLTLALFLVYYTLMDGPAFVSWVRGVIPLPEEVTDGLFAKLDATTRGVVIGHISVALIQAVIAGVGLWAAGIPNAVFWTFVMAAFALLPLIGAFLVWGPAALYLIALGQLTPGVFLAVYGVAVVSTIDNYLRPIVIDQQAHLNPGIILLGVFGGVYSVGFVGLFVGPVAIGVLAATLETFREKYDAI